MSTSNPTKRRRTIEQGTSPEIAIPSRIKPTSNQPANPQAEEDWTSSSGSDSDSDSESVSPAIDAPPVPKPSTTNALPPIDPTIHTRLTSFFSSLAEQRANPDAAAKAEKIEIDDDEDEDSGFEDDDEGTRGQGGSGGNGRQYIELDLALGVLSEKGSDNEDGEVKVPGLGGDEESESGSDDGNIEGESGGENGKGGLAGLTNVAGENAGISQNQRRKARREEQKRKIEEVG